MGGGWWVEGGGPIEPGQKEDKGICKQSSQTRPGKELLPTKSFQVSPNPFHTISPNLDHPPE